MRTQSIKHQPILTSPFDINPSLDFACQSHNYQPSREAQPYYTRDTSHTGIVINQSPCCKGSKWVNISSPPQNDQPNYRAGRKDDGGRQTMKKSSYDQNISLAIFDKESMNPKELMNELIGSGHYHSKKDGTSLRYSSNVR
jgi:hypothetical protein